MIPAWVHDIDSLSRDVRFVIICNTSLWMIWKDLPFKEKYLVTFTVGYDQKDIVKAAISKFSKNWTIVLFHYDGRTSEWEEFEWSQRAIHVSARRQTKCCPCTVPYVLG
ncbi:hypothetical protein L7F22_013147 [Adiantum nelumboides]|nr:hypothetical protein [Adiantum nelumboides]